MSKFCVITLVNPITSERKELKWELVKNSITDRWVALINSANDNGPLIQYTTWGMYDEPERIVEVLVSINTSIRWFNANNGHEFTIPELTQETVTRKSLNFTHAEFEKYALIFLPVNLIGEVHMQNMSGVTKLTCDDLYSMSYHLGNINQCVHAMEKIIEINPRYVCASFSTYLMNSASKPHEIDLKDEDYSAFTLGYNFGDLMLGYATTGKSLFHLFKDNNLDLLEKGGHASPQRVIATNLLAMFYEGTQDRYEREPFYKWFDDNHLDRYGYVKDDPKNGTGNIVLGHLIRSPETVDMTKREFIRYHTDFSEIISVVII